LMFCAQIVGNPVTAPLPAATPAVARMDRRPNRRDDIDAMCLSLPCCPSFGRPHDRVTGLHGLCHRILTEFPACTPVFDQLAVTPLSIRGFIASLNGTAAARLAGHAVSPYDAAA
jgi:hypothetical protein